MKKLFLVLLSTFLFCVAQSQDELLTNAEYYIDVDPGVGAATPITPFSSGTPIDFNLSISTGSLAIGMHTLVIRVQDAAGEWSIQESRPFNVSSQSVATTQNVSEVEYYLDTDPGVGNGTDVPITPAATVDQMENIPTAALTIGFHVAHFRARDADGVWGLPDVRPFYVIAQNISSVENIDAVEYFIDTDPGFGNATDVTITPSTTIDQIENIPTAALSAGFHVIQFRARDTDGVWGISDTRPFYVINQNILTVENIDVLEYFIDTDPGFGNGTDVPITPATTIDQIENISTTALTTGFHVVHFRARDSDGVWGLSDTRPFYVINQDISTVQNTVALEYFIDTDPGFGNGVNVPITSAPSIDIQSLIPTTSLTPGFHVIHFRVRDSDNVWSVRDSRPFFVSTQALITNANVTTLEYFIDTDPGFGAGNSVTIPSGNALDIIELISTNSIPIGFHTIHFRVQDDDGAWGVTESRPFYVSASGVVSQASISSLEFFFDVDPGPGNATAISLTSATSLDILTSIPTGSLSVGFHKLHIRAQDSEGLWSFTEARPIYVNESYQISLIEYYVDTDPGMGNGSQVVLTPSTNIDVDVEVATSALLSGNYQLGVRVKSANGPWSYTQIVPFTICSAPTVDFTPSTVCVGTATSFTDNSITQAGDSYSWDFDSDGVIDSGVTGDASFTYPSSGVYNATLTIDRLGCTDAFTIQVNVGAIPIAQAGTDQAICADNTILEGSSPVAGESGLWSIVNGSGTLTDPTNAESPLSSITTFTTTLEWTVTNSAGGCSDSDQVVITSNLPISSTPLSSDVSLGNSINLNVQTPATINPGDVLITSIVTNPSKGSASVLIDGTITYAPDDGTVGDDLIVYQICNQCNRCSQNTITLTIQNDAPVIDPVPVVVTDEEVTINLLDLISDPNDNLDPTSLIITQQPTSGAVAAIDANGVLSINYTGIYFVGTDQLTIQICDLEDVCSTQIIAIEVNLPEPVDPPILVYNAVSPNGDGKHDVFEIENITAYPNNKVYIFNRWGDKVFEVEGYDNASKSFAGIGNTNGGKDLPAGTYFYSVDRGNGTEVLTGYLVLKNYK